jgi:hypothetical protein
MTRVAGADGFTDGWCVVLANLETHAWMARVVPTFAALFWSWLKRPLRVASRSPRPAKPAESPPV